MRFGNYDTEGFYDELCLPDGTPRPAAEPLFTKINELPEGELQRRQIIAESAFYDNGITFAVYGSKDGKDKIIPFDVIPRIVSAADWKHLEAGLKQRTEALNCFLTDIYNDRKILRI